MFRLYFVFIWLMCVGHLTAQLANNSSAALRPGLPYASPYMYVGLGFSSLDGGAFSATFISRSGWGGVLQAHLLSPDAAALPNGYQKASGGLFSTGFLGGDGKPNDDILLYALRGVRQWPLGDPIMRFGLEVGPSYVRMDRAEDFIPVAQPCDFWGCRANYTHTVNRYSGIGLSARAQMVLAFTRVWGMEVGVHANWNKYRSFVAFEVMQNLGYLRDRRKAG